MEKLMYRIEKLVCKVVGHKGYSKETLAAQPWDYAEFRGFPLVAFREPTCLRCDERLDTVEFQEQDAA